MSKSLHLWKASLLFLLTQVCHSHYLNAQCNEPNDDAIFRFTSGNDTLFVNANCISILDYGNPNIETTSTDQVIDTDASGIDPNLTTHPENASLGAGEQVTVYYIGVEAAPGTRRDTFCYTIDIVDPIAPAFQNPPLNETVCAGNIPEFEDLRVLDNCSSEANIQVQMSEDTIGGLDVCRGGMLRRTWTAEDESGNTASTVQIIMVEEDTEAPNPNYEIRPDTAFCENSGFSTWVSAALDSLAANASDNCGIARIDKNGPSNFRSCGTILVEFYIEDECENITTLTSSYTIQDTVAPVFVESLPNITVSACDFRDVDTLAVSVVDNCVDTRDLEIVVTQVPTFLGDACGTVLLTRTYEAKDGCGNSSFLSHTITVVDEEAPEFDVPDDITVNCGIDFDDLDVLGTVDNIVDNCPSGNNTIAYEDSLSGTGGLLEIRRLWTVTDVCGNSRTKVQIIGLIDDIAPVFDPPFDISVSCGDLNNLSVTGEPAMLSDNCDPTPVVSFEDITDSGGAGCFGNGSIIRRWRIEDNAGNFTTSDQEIRIEDETPPLIIREAMDMNVDCMDTTNIGVLFEEWVTRMGDAFAMDNCTEEQDLIWTAYNTGTLDAPNLPIEDCPSDSTSIFRTQTVDFIVEDICGNSDTTTASFNVFDNVAPVFAFCPSDTTLLTVGNTCSANFMFIPPRVIESCGAIFGNYSRSVEADIFSDDPGNMDVPVNDVRLSFSFLPSQDFPFGNVSLTLELTNVDSDQAPEYFNVYLEDGTPIGRTLNSTARCGNSTTVLTDITPDQLIQAAGSNNLITFFLRPNIDPSIPASFSMSDVCGGSAVRATLEFETRTPRGTTYSYQLNDDPITGYLPSTPVQRRLEAGVNTIVYFVTDCAGNSVSCSYRVIVTDSEAPGITCPDDVVLPLEGENCSVRYELPLPEIVTDNCIFGNASDIIVPSDSAQALLTYTFQPDLLDFLADDKTLSFPDVARSTINDVSLVISLRGDMDNDLAYFNIIGEDGSPLGTTLLGQANVSFGDCQRFSEIFLTIPASSYNLWAADGQLDIIAAANRNIPIPPNGPGDGFNPCDQTQVNQDGDSDGTSMIFARLTFNDVQYSYYTEGATNTPLTVVSDTVVQPELEFAIGKTEVFYVVEDANANRDTCSFNVTIQDNEEPIAVCRSARIFINPSGIATDTLMPIDVDGGSSDNCGIDSMFVSPNVFECGIDFDEFVDVTLTVIDRDGNTASCVAPVNVVTEMPNPDFFVRPCGGDTLFLFANPPAAPAGMSYLYNWTGPNGFTSELANPIIPGITTVNQGSYSVLITGLTNCTASGTVEVSLDEELIRPSIEVPETLCSGDDISLNTNRFEGLNVVYLWYEITASGDSLVGTSMSSSLTFGGGTAGMKSYAVQLSIDGCLTNLSDPASLEIIDSPVASIRNPNPAPICEGGIIQLATDVSGADLEYEWTGPNGFRSSSQIPAVIEDASTLDAGTYNLTISRNGCISERVSTLIEILPRPARPVLLNNGPICAGENITLSVSDSTANIYYWLPPNSNSEFTTFGTGNNTFDLNAPTAVDAGAWRAYVTSNGCASEISEPSLVVINAVPELFVSANPTALCEGSTLTLEASPTLLGATYRWVGPSGYEAATQNPVLPNISALNQGSYTCFITTADGCTNQANVDVTVDAGVEIIELQDNGQQCNSGPTDILMRAILAPRDDGSYEYRWTGPNGYTSTDSIATIPGATEEDNGNYTLEVTNSSGCPSASSSIVISIRDIPSTPAAPMLSQGTPSPFCDGDIMTLVSATSYSGQQVEYNWITPEGIKQTNIPSYTDNELDSLAVGEYALFVTVDGCTSGQSGVLQVEVGEAPLIDVSSNSPICEGDRLTLSANSEAGATFEWVGPGGFTASVASPFIPIADRSINEGVYRVTATRDGCTSEAVFVDIIINPLPRRPIGAAAPAVCIDETDAVLRLGVAATSATPGATYVWYDEDGGAISTLVGGALLANITDFTGFTQGTQFFSVQAELEGCLSPFSEIVEVQFDEIPNQNAFAGDDLASCGETSLMLAAADPSVGTAVWTQVGGDSTDIRIINPSDDNSIVTGLMDNNEYFFAWTLSNGVCLDYATDTVSVLISSQTGAFAGEPIDTCLVSSVQLNATEPVSGQGMWRQPQAQDSLGVMIEDLFDPNSIITGLRPGNQYIFIWEVLGAACGDSEDVTIVTVSGGFAYAGLDSEECGDGCTTLNAEPSPTRTGEWSSPDISISFNNASDPTSLVCGLQEGQNMLIWTVDNGACGDASRDTVIITYQSPATLEDDAIIMQVGESADIDVRENDFFPIDLFTIGIATEPLNGTVEDLGNGNFRYRSNPSFAGLDVFEYEVCVLGCDCVRASVDIIVQPPVECTIPNIFTPNGDGVNDLFVITCLSSGLFKGNNLTIFNQWGDEVFQMTDYDNSWDGTFDGEPLPDGQYYYIMDFNDGDLPDSGYIQILR